MNVVTGIGSHDTSLRKSLLDRNEGALVKCWIISARKTYLNATQVEPLSRLDETITPKVMETVCNGMDNDLVDWLIAYLPEGYDVAIDLPGEKVQPEHVSRLIKGLAGRDEAVFVLRSTLFESWCFFPLSNEVCMFETDEILDEPNRTVYQECAKQLQHLSDPREYILIDPVTKKVTSSSMKIYKKIDADLIDPDYVNMMKSSPFPKNLWVTMLIKEYMPSIMMVLVGLLLWVYPELNPLLTGISAACLWYFANRMASGKMATIIRI